MRQKHSGKPAVFVLLFLLVFLCVIPVVSHAAQSSGTLPEPTGSDEVEPGTIVSELRSIFALSSDYGLTVLKADGSVRAGGPVETGDRAVITNPSGEMLDCVALTVRGEPAPSSGSASSSGPSEASSVPPGPSSSSVPANGQTFFSDSTRVESLAAVFSGQASRVSVFKPDGAKRGSGLVCTGDVVVLQDQSGNAFRTVSVTVLGDLTRCGTVTPDGCSLLYRYLTDRDSFPADLLLAADMNRDGRVDTADLLKMKWKLRSEAAESAASPGENR